MTKEEIEKLFINIGEDNLEGFLSYITGELQNKLNSYSDKEEFYDDYEEEIFQNIASNVPEELYEYFVKKSIEYGTIEFINCVITDDKGKFNIIDELNSDYDKYAVAATITDSKLKMDSLDKITDQSYKSWVAITIDEPEYKLKSLDKITDRLCKRNVAITITNLDYKIQSLEKFENYRDKEKIVESFNEEEVIEFSKRKFDNEQIKSLIKYAKDSILIKNKFQDALKDLEEKDINFRIGLPEDMTIGIELESEGDFSEVLLDKQIAPGWTGTGDGSLLNGVEVNSPVLRDTEEDMKMLEAVCNTMKNFGLGTSERCGGHIHIGADYFEGNPKAFQNLSNIWYQCEELFYKMANESGTVPRSGITRYAKTMHKDLEDFTEEEMINIQNISDFEDMRKKLVRQVPKYRGLNLGHYGEIEKNTIEFRIPNGTINPKTIKENIKLFGSLMQVSKEMALNPEFKKEEFKTVMNEKLTEGEKVEALLDLLFDDEKTKSIYRERWESVRDEKIFDELTEGQTQTFKRGDYSISSKQEIRDVATSEEAIEQMSGVSEEIKREVKEKQQQNQISNNTSIEDSTDAR